MAAKVLLSWEQRSALLELFSNLSAVFWGLDLAQCRAICEKGHFRPFDRLAPVLGNSVREVLEKLIAVVASYPDAPALFDSLEEDFIPLFVNARGGIAAPLYQSCYAETPSSPDANVLMGSPAVMMQQRLSAAGLTLAHSSNEPPDHLAIEIEYLYFLLQKGWGENGAVHLQEAVSFVNTELLGWVPGFEERLRTTNPDSFYALAAAILVGALRLVADF